MIKRAAGWFIQGDSSDTGPTLPWRARIHRRLCDAIRAGQLPAGSRLPSARQLAREWGVARSTVDDAFAQLQAEGYIQRRVGKGSFVADRLPPGAVGVADRPPPTREPNQATQQALSRLRPITDDPADYALHGQRGLRLRPQLTDIDHFPLADWRQMLAHAYRESQRDRLSYGAAAGTFELRVATARHLALTRALTCSPRQVLIVESTLQALDLISRVLLEPGADVCLCDPGHISTPRFFSLMHMQVHNLPMDAEGMDITAGQRLVPRPAAVVVQPLSQYPLGTPLSVSRREQLLHWAGRSGAWVIELDFLGEISFGKSLPLSLLAQDRQECVLLIGSYSSIMFPSLRLAYLVVPERLCNAFAAVRGLLGDHSPVAQQMAMTQFIEEGRLAAHARLLQGVYTQRRDAMLGALQRHPALWAAAHPVPSGVNICVGLPPAWPDHSLQTTLAARGVAPGILSAHAREATGLNGLVMGFGADSVAAIAKAVDDTAAVLSTSHGR